MKKITLILLLIVGAVMSQEKQYGYEYIKESGDIKEYHMTSNGLKVLLKELKGWSTTPKYLFLQNPFSCRLLLLKRCLKPLPTVQQVPRSAGWYSPKT